jgi:hypothetical protein
MREEEEEEEEKRRGSSVGWTCWTWLGEYFLSFVQTRKEPRRTCYYTQHAIPTKLSTGLLQCRLQGLQDLWFTLALSSDILPVFATYLEFDLGLSNVLFAAASIGNLLGLCDLAPDGLLRWSAIDLISTTALNMLTSALKSSRGYPSTALMLSWEPGCTTANPPDRKNCLLPPASSMTSTSPGFSCSIDGTWFAKTPISPVSAGRLT